MPGLLNLFNKLGMLQIDFSTAPSTFDLGLTIPRRLRCILLWLLVMAAGGVPLIEQPATSIMNMHDRFRWMVKLLEGHHIQAPLTETKVTSSSMCFTCDSGLKSVVGNLCCTCDS